MLEKKKELQGSVDNKYYTPSIEEFYVGFEYEVLGYHALWEPHIYTPVTWVYVDIDGGEAIDELSEHLGEDADIRVKYLDKTDIESLGFSNPQYFKDADYYGYTKDDIRLYLKPTHDGIILTKINEVNGDEVLFNGNIKNKSELKKLLIWLDITLQK